MLVRKPDKPGLTSIDTEHTDTHTNTNTHIHIHTQIGRDKYITGLSKYNRNKIIWT